MLLYVPLSKGKNRRAWYTSALILEAGNDDDVEDDTLVDEALCARRISKSSAACHTLCECGDACKARSIRFRTELVRAWASSAANACCQHTSESVCVSNSTSSSMMWRTFCSKRAYCSCDTKRWRRMVLFGNSFKSLVVNARISLRRSTDFRRARNDMVRNFWHMSTSGKCHWFSQLLIASR